MDFSLIMNAVRDCDDCSPKIVHNLLFDNGVERRPIPFHDPYHIANLCVTWASVFAFGDTEKADHTHVHHCQLLQSIHSLHSLGYAYFQAMMDEVMAALGKSV